MSAEDAVNEVRGRRTVARVRGTRLQLVRLPVLLLLHMQIMENVLEFLAKVNNMLIAQTRNTPALCGCVCVCVNGKCKRVCVRVCLCVFVSVATVFSKITARDL